MIDLHAHTTASDGTDAPSDLLAKASSIGLTAIAVTDHDTVDGLAEAIDAGKQLDLEVVPGIELSIEDSDDRRFHLLAYFFDPNDGPLNEILSKVRQWRDDRNTLIVRRAQAAGIDLTIEDVIAEAGADSHVIGRPHFAAALIKKGFAATIQEAFDKYLATGRPLNEPKPSLTSKQAGELIHNAGGVTVIAHPGLIKWAEYPTLREYVGELKDNGSLDGLECYYSRHDAAQTERYLKLAEDFGLVVTGGSDYHGGNKPDIELGRVWENGPLPIILLDRLRDCSRRYSSTPQAAV